MHTLFLSNKIAEVAFAWVPFPEVEFEAHLPWKSITQILKSRADKIHSLLYRVSHIINYSRWNTEPWTCFLASKWEEKGMNFQHSGASYRTFRSWPKLFQEKKLIPENYNFQILDSLIFSITVANHDSVNCFLLQEFFSFTLRIIALVPHCK